MAIAPFDHEASHEGMPLFMAEVPETTEGNVALEMIQAMLAEGTPDERAANLRNHGNEAYALGTPGHIRDAARYYTRALEQGATDAVLNATLHINRAAAFLALGEYAAAVADAERFFAVAPAEGVARSVRIKAHARRARAALHLGDVDTAAEAIGGLRSVLDEMSSAGDGGAEAPPVLLDLVRDFEAADAPLRRVRETLRPGMDDLASRKARPRVIRGAEDEVLAVFPDDETRAQAVESLGGVRRVSKRLLWPVILFYPSDGQTDALGAVSDDATIGDVLKHVLGTPPPWDEHRRYARLSSLRVFYVSKAPPCMRNRPFAGERLVALGHGATLSRLVAGGHVLAIERGILALHVVPSSDAHAFVQRFGSVHATVD